MKRFYTHLLEPAVAEPAGAPPAPGVVADLPGEGAISRGQDGELTFNDGGLPTGVEPPPPAPARKDTSTTVKPDTSVQPPAKPTGDDFDMFQAVKDGKPLADKPLSEPVPPKPPVKAPEVPPAKPVAEPKSAPDKPAPADNKFKFDPFKGKKVDPANPQQQQQQVPAGERDYSGLEAQEVEMFKKMGNDAFATLKPIYLQHKQLKANPPQPVVPQLNVHEHPEAYTLTPEYKEAVNYQQRAHYESSHWQQQLAKLRAGEKWQDIAMKDGQYVDGPEYDPSPNAEAHIIANMTKTSQIAQQAQGQLQQVQQHFGNYYQQSVKAVRDAESKFFPFYDNPDNPHKEVIMGFLTALPAPLRSDPLAPMLAKAGAAYRETIRQLEEAHDRIAQLEGKHQEQQLVQGSQRSMGANGSGGKPNGNGTNVPDLLAAFNAQKEV